MENKEKKNYKNKIFLIILIVLFFVSSTILTYILIKHNDIKHDNEQIKNEIKKTQDNIVSIDDDYNNNSRNLNVKKSELKEKIEEYNIWIEMKEKIK